MRKPMLFAILLCLPLAGGCVKKEFKEFDSGEGKFSVLMPGSPERKSQTIMGIKLVMYGVDVSNGAYAVGYADIPSGTPFSLPGAVQGVAGTHGGKIVSEKDYVFEGYAGREFEIETSKPKGHICGRAIVIDRRFYQILAMGDTIRLADADTQKYLTSFKLKK